jgi:hypothetical protein
VSQGGPRPGIRDPAPGRGIVRFGWAANALFVVTAVPAAAGLDAFGAVSVIVALTLFFVAIGVFVVAFVTAAGRSAQGDEIAVASLFFLQGSAPTGVQRQFLAMFAACLVIAVATVVWAPFGFLVPMLPIGLAGLWGARYGTFPPRLPTARR